MALGFISSKSLRLNCFSFIITADFYYWFTSLVGSLFRLLLVVKWKLPPWENLNKFSDSLSLCKYLINEISAWPLCSVIVNELMITIFD